MKQRIAYLDNAKALLILLVALVHVLNYANPGYDIIPYILPAEFISSFIMQAFFLISGILADEEKWKKRNFRELLLSRTKTLLVPYFFFESIAVLYKGLVLHTVSIPEGLRLMVTFRCNVGANWYLPALFLANLFYFGYVRCPGKYKWVPACLISLIGVRFLPAGHWWGLLFRGILGFGFLLVGNLLKKQLTQVNPWKALAAFGLTAVSSGICFKLDLDNGFYSCALEAPVLFLISGVCGLYFILAIARCLHMKWLRFIGENTLVIMGTHQLVLYTIPSSSSPLWVAGALLLIAAVEAVLIFATNRFCPVLIGKSRKVP